MERAPFNSPTLPLDPSRSLFVSAGVEAAKAQQQQQSAAREAAELEAAGPAPTSEGQEGAAGERAEAEAAPGPRSPGKAAAERVLEASESDGPQSIGAIWGRSAALRQQQEAAAREGRGEAGEAEGAGQGQEEGLGSFYLNMPLELLK